MNHAATALPAMRSASGILLVCAAIAIGATSARAGGITGEEANETIAPRTLSEAAPQSTVGSESDPIDGDYLYIGEDYNSSVRRFDVRTGKYLGEFVSGGSGGLWGPRGLIFTQGALDVVSQCPDPCTHAGEVMRYGGRSGAFLGKLVAQDNPNAPFSPRAIVRGPGRTVFVSNYETANGMNAENGWVGQFDLDTGKLLRHLDLTGFRPAFYHPGFWPRGMVTGPDGLLYVAGTGDRELDTPPGPDGLTGYVLRFDPYSGRYVDTFAFFDGPSGPASDHHCAKHLHRPEGLAFGPDGRLYVTAFRADPTDTDKILILDGRSGRCLDYIDLAPSEASGGVRAYGQSILFGPRGRLYFTAVNTGELRRYDVRSKKYEALVGPCATADGTCILTYPWYMTFGRTDPKTLEYDE